MKLVVIIGPPAVGKMTVGQELAKLTGMKLFHNHATIDLVLPFFQFGTPPFQRLVGEFRRRMFEEIASSRLKGLIFTYVWAFGNPAEDRWFRQIARIFLRRGAPVYLVELAATLRERLRRNRTPNRLRHKPFKRNLRASERQLRADERRYAMNSPAGWKAPAPHLKLDVTRLSARAAARSIRHRFHL